MDNNQNLEIKLIDGNLWIKLTGGKIICSDCGNEPIEGFEEGRFLTQYCPYCGKIKLNSSNITV